MRTRKIVTYVLMVSKVFPAYHPRRGQPTHFHEKIHKCIDRDGVKNKVVNAMEFNFYIYGESDPKLHTIRLNYDLWASRAEKINAGEAVLSLRQWTGKPYASKQVEILRLEKIGVQRAKVYTVFESMVNKIRGTNIEGRSISIHDVAKNDGLSTDDFCKWFKKDMDGVIIHFTDKLY
jgi:hypothetical protein